MKNKKHRIATGLLCSTIVLVAIAVATVGSVLVATETKSDATILDLFSGERSKTKRFADVLVRLGHEKPRPYRLDGNKVYISVRNSRKAPNELIEEYQHAFASEGLNEKPMLDTKHVNEILGFLVGAKVEESSLKSGLETAISGLNGGIFPIIVTDDYVRMIGGDPSIEIKDHQDLEKLANQPPESAFKAIRTIEMFKNRASETTVVATFSDETLDITRMLNDKDGVGRNGLSSKNGIYNENLPACRSCVRVHQLEDLDPGVTYIGNVYRATENPDDILYFYDTLYKNRGWKLDYTSELFSNNNDGLEDNIINSQSEIQFPENMRYHRVYHREGTRELVQLSITMTEKENYVDLKYLIEEEQ